MVPNKRMQGNTARTENAKHFMAGQITRATSGVDAMKAANLERQAGSGSQTESLGSGSERESPNSVRRDEENNSQNIVNKVMLAGLLGRDAEVRETKGGRVVANFSIGVDEFFKNGIGGWRKKISWHRVQVWDEVAEEISADLRKGARVYVEGRLIVRDWLDKQNKKHIVTEIVASDVNFLFAPAGNQLGDLAKVSARGMPL